MKAADKLVAAGAYLMAGPRRMEAMAPDRFDGLATATVLLGLLMGLGQVGVWELSHRVVWVALGHLNWLVQSGLTAATMLVACRRAVRALAATLAGGRRVPRWALAAAVVAAAWWMYNTLGWGANDWPTQLHPSIKWLWPTALYRALLLAPVWGAWGMLALGRFHRCDGQMDEPTRRLVAGVGPTAVAAYLAATLAASLVYFNHLYPWHFVPPAAALAAAIGGGAILARLRGRLDRGTLLATNLVTQAAFIGGYNLVTGL